MVQERLDRGPLAQLGGAPSGQDTFFELGLALSAGRTELTLEQCLQRRPVEVDKAGRPRLGQVSTATFHQELAVGLDRCITPAGQDQRGVAPQPVGKLDEGGERLAGPLRRPGGHVRGLVGTGHRATLTTGRRARHPPASAWLANLGLKGKARADVEEVKAIAESLGGAVAVVTGGSAGIGLAIARALSAKGALVVVTGRSEERLEQARRQLPGRSCAVVADVSAPGAARAAVDAALGTFGGLDIVVANAGAYLSGPVWQSEPADIDRLISTNIGGAVQAARAALPVLLGKGAGDIVVTSSVSGYQAIHWEPVYSASKHALRAFVHGLRRQLAGTGVRVGEIAPGVVHTELWAAAGVERPETIAGKTGGISSEDVAEAVLFMLTRPRHVTVRDLVLLPSDQDI